MTPRASWKIATEDRVAVNLLSIIVGEPILKKHAKPWWALANLAIVTLILAIQLFIKINRYAVNLFYMDQWDTYKPLFRGDNLWRIFLAQEGQLRLGVGGWVCAAVASTTAWNTRAESDRSSDLTVTLAQEMGLTTFVHDGNLGYGRNQKTCYSEALKRRADIIIMLHPDYQYTPSLSFRWLE
ncbi:MAG TPA: hypothetical protein VMZ30_09750 [Pyrinomonadaceae bacterium]|nr:hypothetical protein [Pyrinomonadaceae bacterium]